MLKIIIITEYRTENDGKFPKIEENNIKGHKILELWNSANLESLEGIEKDILTFLDYFAGYLRYYNLDNIMEKKGKNMCDKDPLYQWREIQERISESLPKRKYKNRDMLCAMLDECCITRVYDMKGCEVQSISPILEEVANEDLIQGYSVELVFKIIKIMKKKIDELEDRKYMLPVLSEFFDYYTDYWKPFEVRRKKNWLNI